MKNIHLLLTKLKRTSSQRFIPEIDALRFFAIIPVMLMHFGTAMLDENNYYIRENIDQTSYLRKILLEGSDGVILFFSISGFILALPFIGKKVKDLHFKNYFIRRLVRIEPPYVIAITLFLFVHIILNAEVTSFLLERYFASLFYLHNIIYNEWPYILPVAWSLEIEVQFYLLMPLFLYFICLYQPSKWRYFVYFVLFIFFINVDLLKGMDLSDYMYAFIPGIVAADFYKNKILNRHIFWDFVLIIVLPLFFLHNGSNYLTALLLFLIIISSLNLVLLRKVVTSNIVVIIGGMCYSLYLLHYPLYFLFTKLFSNKLTFFGIYELDYIFQALIFVPISILLVSVYFLLAEKPFMNLSKKVKEGLSFRQLISKLNILKWGK